MDSVDLELDSHRQLVLATSEASDVAVRRWNEANGTWDLIGAPFHGAFKQVAEVHLAFGSDNTPYVAWLEGTDGSNAARILAASFDGQQWNQLGGELDNTPNATQNLWGPAISFDNGPVVASIKAPARSLSLKRWAGAAWVDETTVDQGNYTGNTVSLLAFANQRTLAFADEGKALVRQFDGQSWGAASDAFNGPSAGKNPEPLPARGGGRIFMSELANFDLGNVVRVSAPASERG